MEFFNSQINGCHGRPNMRVAKLHNQTDTTMEMAGWLEAILGLKCKANAKITHKAHQLQLDFSYPNIEQIVAMGAHAYIYFGPKIIILTHLWRNSIIKPTLIHSPLESRYLKRMARNFSSGWSPKIDPLFSYFRIPDKQFLFRNNRA